MGDVNHEPSMEEILASIKRIIAEDGEGAVPPGRRPRARMPEPPSATPAADDEVLELTHRVDDPPVPEPEPASSAPAELPPSVGQDAGDPSDLIGDAETGDEPLGTAPAAAEAPSHADAATDAAPEDELVSATTRQASRQALAALSALVVRAEPPGSDTLEGLVRDMLRPMLKDWLDARLPAIVEQVVAREIARIADERA